MLIDWFTVGAQALNFVILVWLMKRYLYGPILAVVDARDERIATELADAKKKQAAAEQSRNEFQQKNTKLDADREALMAAAKKKAKAEGERLLAAAREAAEAASTKYRQALETTAEGMNRALATRAQQEVFAIARKVLADLATASLEERMTDVFVDRLRGLEDPAKANLAQALKSATDPALLRSAFDLPDAQKEAIKEAVNETFSMDAPIHFETAPELVGGIELTANGRKVAWSIAEYLRSLTDGVRELVGEKEQLKVKAEADATADAEEAAHHHGT